MECRLQSNVYEESVSWMHGRSIKKRKVVGVDATVEVMTSRSCSLGTAEE